MQRSHSRAWVALVRVGRTLWGLARELHQIVVPLSCAGCGAYDVELCDSCLRQMVPRTQWLDAETLPIASAAQYSGTVREILMRWKERGRADLSAWIRAACEMAAHDVGAISAFACDWGTRDGSSIGGADTPHQLVPALHILTGQNQRATCQYLDRRFLDHGAQLCAQGVGESASALVVAVVPIPSAHSATRRRDFVPAEVIAQGFADGLRIRLRGQHVMCSHRVFVIVVRAFTIRRQRHDQVGLGRKGRRRNAHGSLQLSQKSQQILNAATTVVLADDIVTTGSTLGAALRALPAHLRTKVYGFALAHTPKN